MKLASWVVIAAWMRGTWRHRHRSLHVRVRGAAYLVADMALQGLSITFISLCGMARVLEVGLNIQAERSAHS